MLASAKIKLQVDCGFGDVITPDPIVTDFPTLLDFPAPRLPTYPKETVVAEKFKAITRLGLANSRMKDFYDIWVLASDFPFSGQIITSATRQAVGQLQGYLTDVDQSPESLNASSVK